MKNILLPTDLSVQSLWPIHTIVKEAKNQRLSIQVVHMLSLPTGIGDLLSLREDRLYSQIPANFIDAFQMLCHKYKSALEKIEFRFIYCSTSRYFNNYVEGNNIHEVYILGNYNYSQPLPQSENFKSYLNKCKVPVNQLTLHNETFEYQNLSTLLNGNEHYKTTPNRVAKPTVSYS